ncbi:ThuA domain-containing protein [Dactylosporangium sp. NPDC005555]|uniref:ThuA domain-containing protein n=1 Tax=Dactylosporangium sp. NPDC005555 TaxID=3154889 RepID=UPI0033AE2B0A
MLRRLLAAAGLAVLITATLIVPGPPASAATLTNVLVFSKTAGFRHSSIPNGIAAIQQLGAANGFTVTATEDAGQFTTANLARFQAVVWLSTTGDVLDAAQQSAFEAYIGAGGGYVGIHAAADTEYDWAWYGALVGGYFASHPAIQTAGLRVEDQTNPSTAHLPATWTRSDEWYNYRTNPRSSARVLINLDEGSYSGGSMGDHPITWCKNYAGGRAWYTGLGHTEDSWTEPAFTRMLLGGLRIAAGAVQADCSPRTTQPTAPVALRAQANNRIVAAENAGAAPLIANRTAVGGWEQFDVVDLGGGNVALRARINGLYVCADNAGVAPLIANRTAVGAWETFALITNADGTVSLRAQANGRYVVAENGGNDPLIANRTAIGPWEKFTLVPA